MMEKKTSENIDQDAYKALDKQVNKKCHTCSKTAVAVKKSRTQANKSNIDAAKNQEHKQHKGVLIHKLKKSISDHSSQQKYII